MRKLTWLAIVLGLLLAGKCTPALQAAPPPPTTHMVTADGLVAGDVYVWHDTDFMTLEIRMVDETMCLAELNYHVAYDLAGLPMTGAGNPRLSQFDYAEELSCATFFYRWIPLNAMPDQTSALYVAVEGVTAAGEVWAEGVDFPGRQWGEYVLIPLGPDPTS